LTPFFIGDPEYNNLKGDMLLRNILVLFVVSIILGLASITIPVILTGGIQAQDEVLFPQDEVLFPLITSGIENFSLFTLCLLVISGAIIGYLVPRHKVWLYSAWLWGYIIITPLPILAIVEIIIYPASHNLFPFELLFYNFLSIPAILGILGGIFVRWIIIRLISGKVIKR
jgi:hypothetical protein